MKKFLTASALLCVMVMVSLASPAALPNYAGTWVLDKDKSTGLPPQMTASTDAIQWVVTQDANKLTVKSNSMGGSQEVPYNLDGSKSKAQMGGRMPGEATVYLEKKDDGKVVLHSERELNFQGNAVTIKITQAWELADGGKTLKVKQTVESPRGTQEASLVFTLKS